MKIGIIEFKDFNMLLEDICGGEFITWFKDKSELYFKEISNRSMSSNGFQGKIKDNNNILNELQDLKIKLSKEKEEFSSIDLRNSSDLYKSYDRLLDINSLLKYKNYTNIEFYYLYSDDKWTLINYEINKHECFLFIKTEALILHPYKDYSDIPLNSLSLSMGSMPSMMSLPSLSGDSTFNSAKEALEEKKRDLEKNREEIEHAQEQKAEELEKIKLELEAKYKSMMEVIENKKVELELKKKELETELFVLETQIYGIRCFFGETINFNKIVSGNNESIEEPIVLYQKMRFLDEELGKIASIYDFTDENKDLELLETLLANREDIRDYFMPAGRSISIVKLSADGKIYKFHSKQSLSGNGRNANIVVNNIMESTEKFHGNRIAILLRNGDNCYIGWTDADRINFNSEDLFLESKTEIKGVDEIEPTDYFEKRRYEDELKKEKEEMKDSIISRYFIFSILQGVCKNSNLLPLKEGDLFSASKYVIYSIADNWISDNTYGTFGDILNKTKGRIKKGDDILTLRGLSPEGEIYKSYNNDRGRGYANRTHDVSCNDNSIYSINLVEEDVFYITQYEKKDPFDKNKTNSYKSRGRMESVSLSGECFNLREEEIREQHYFISLEKSDPWWYDNEIDSSRNRANFEVYDTEFINLTFLNTDYIRYVIFNKKAIATIIMGNVINFAYMLPYLNHALQYLKEREETETILLEKAGLDFEKFPDWRIRLSDWRLEHDKHGITENLAKRFVISLD